MAMPARVTRRSPPAWSLAAAILWLALASSVHGLIMVVAVTPSSLDHGNYTFSVSTNETQNGVSFHVVVTAKTGAIPPDYSSIGLSLVHRLKTGTNGYGTYEGSLKPPVRVTLKKDTRVWQADFTIPRQALWRRDLCCVFMEIGTYTSNGQRSFTGSATSYELKLQGFLKP
jgi:hypothetical protein